RLLVRPLQEPLDETELSDDLQRRWVDRVATEIAQEVLVFLEDYDLDACPREQQAEHHASRPSARDRDRGRNRFHSRTAAPDRTPRQIYSGAPLLSKSPGPLCRKIQHGDRGGVEIENSARSASELILTRWGPAQNRESPCPPC